MIQDAFTCEPKGKPKTDAQQQSDFTAEGAPAADMAIQTPAAAADDAIDDWDAMFCAVKDRLRQAVGEGLPAPMNGSVAALRAIVLDCVDALEQLHRSLQKARAGPE